MNKTKQIVRGIIIFNLFQMIFVIGKCPWQLLVILEEIKIDFNHRTDIQSKLLFTRKGRLLFSILNYCILKNNNILLNY